MAVLGHTTNEEEVVGEEDIDSWKSWKEVGKAQLAVSLKNSTADFEPAAGPLVTFERWGQFISEMPIRSDHRKDLENHSYNHYDWQVTARPIEYSESGAAEEISFSHWTKSICIPWASKRNPQVFQLFPALPIEIRQLIWKYALPAPRILKLVVSTSFRRPPLRTCFATVQSMTYDDGDFCSLSMNLKLTCRESYQVFGDNYFGLKLLGSSIASLWEEDAHNELSDIGGIAHVHFRSVSIDLKRDTLFLQDDDLEALYQQSAWLDLSSVQNLAIHYKGEFRNPSAISDILRQSPMLRALKVVIGPSYPSLELEQRAGCLLLPSAYRGKLHFLDLKSTLEPVLHQSSVIQTAWITTWAEIDDSLGKHFKALKAEAQFIRASLNSHADIKSLSSSVDFNICVSSLILGSGCSGQVVPLVPTRPKYSGVGCYAIMPPEIVPPEKQVNEMYIDKLQCFASCLSDGTLLSAEDMMDGDAMRKLFEEDD